LAAAAVATRGEHDGTKEWTNSLFNYDASTKDGHFYTNPYNFDGNNGELSFMWQANWDGKGGPHVRYCQELDGEWYKLWKCDGSATGFYLAELNCPHSYYDDDHYCAMEFRCYVDDSASPKGFSYTLYDDC